MWASSGGRDGDKDRVKQKEEGGSPFNLAGIENFALATTPVFVGVLAAPVFVLTTPVFVLATFIWTGRLQCLEDVSMSKDGEGRAWTYRWGSERSNSEREKEEDGSEFKSEHGRD